MKNKYLVIVGDPDTDTWTVAGESDQPVVANRVFEDLKEDGTPTILIFTGDFIQV